MWNSLQDHWYIFDVLVLIGIIAAILTLRNLALHHRANTLLIAEMQLILADELGLIKADSDPDKIVDALFARAMLATKKMRTGSASPALLDPP